MIRLPRAVDARARPEFEAVLKQEIEQIEAEQLPLQRGLATSSYVTERPFKAMIISAREDAGVLRVKAGIFYTGIIAGCSCADDPTPIEEQNEYCVLRFDIDPRTAEASVTLLDE